jgi:hypothetical protein
MATFYGYAGVYDKALPMALRAFQLWLQLFGLNHPNTRNAYQNLGTAYTKIGHTAEEFYHWVAQQ